MKTNQTPSNGQAAPSSWIERVRQQRQARRRELLSKQVEKSPSRSLAARFAYSRVLTLCSSVFNVMLDITFPTLNQF